MVVIDNKANTLMPGSRPPKRERVWLHKPKPLGLLQILKATN